VHKKKSTAVHHRRRPAFAVLIIPFSDVLFFYAQVQKIHGQFFSEKGIITTAKAGHYHPLPQFTSGQTSAERRPTYPFVLVHKKKSTAVHHRRRPAFAVLIIPFSDVLPIPLPQFTSGQTSAERRPTYQRRGIGVTVAKAGYIKSTWGVEIPQYNPLSPFPLR
jgi:hypothetical protein